MMQLKNKHFVLGLTAGIACYKAAELCRELVKHDATVQVVMTESAQQFITPVTMQALSGREVFTSQWDSRQSNNMAHINLSREADAILIAPASADFVAKLLHGRADDLLSLMCLARPIDTVPLIVAPAMNKEMWANPATQRNMQQLSKDGAYVLGVGAGDQACGEVGDGRMLEPAEILESLVAFFTPKLMTGMRVVLTAGPTYEAIDPVRGVTNLSSGKMGFALARACQRAGARVTLISGPVGLETPQGVDRVNVVSAQQMHDSVMQHIDCADIFIGSAAVADWRPGHVAAQKIKKEVASDPAGVQSPGALMNLSWVENPDILSTVARSKRALSGQLYCVGFAAESENLQELAARKRVSKGVPLLVANLAPNTFGKDENALLIVDENSTQELAWSSKEALSQELVQHIVKRMKAR
jgi:phosphopantothenoylcysteine decarboxylase / phosphopantothenate---cysteine ligase